MLTFRKTVMYDIYLNIRNLLATGLCFLSIPSLSTWDKFCISQKKLDSKSLDLGCGKTPKNPFVAESLYGVDVDYGVDPKNNIYPCDLGIEKLPFPDEHFDFVTAFDLIEHIPRLAYIDNKRHSPFIFLMNEVCRVLKKDGVFLSHTPAYPKIAAFSDPTHVNVISVKTFQLYFCSPYNWASRYGFDGAFELIKQGWDKENLVTLMRKKN